MIIVILLIPNRSFCVLTKETACNFMNYFEILPASNTRYKIRLTDIKDKGACFGFSTTKGFGNNYNFYSPESVYYARWGTGSVYEGGKENKIGLAWPRQTATDRMPGGYQKK